MATSVSLDTLPLELRHRIYGYICQRPEGPKKVLRWWYEKLEGAEIAAQHAQFLAAAKERADREAATEEEDEMMEVDDDDEDEDDENDEDQYDDDDDGYYEEDDDYELPPPPVSTKWRHVPKVMRFTHCPPPLNLLLTSKQFHSEAIAYFYEVAAIQVDATASFEHQTFFEEEVFDKVCAAAYSPLHQLQNLTVTFTWDTAWVRNTEGVIIEVWEYELYQRARKVASLLYLAPELKKVKISWHDSEKSTESLKYKTEVMNILCDVKSAKPELRFEVKERFEKDGQKVEEKTTMGKKRAEFDKILEGGQWFH